MLVVAVLITVTTILISKYDRIYESYEICDIIGCCDSVDSCDRCEVVTVFYFLYVHSLWQIR